MNHITLQLIRLSIVGLSIGNGVKTLVMIVDMSHIQNLRIHF